MTDRELMQQALEALTAYDGTNGASQRKRVLAALRERLAQPEQEPVAWVDEFGNVFPLGAQRGPKHLNEPMKPLYTTPPRREWVGLTDEQIVEIYTNWESKKGTSWADLMRAVEAAHDIKETKI